MMRSGFGDTHHVVSWLAYAPVMDIFAGKAVIHGIVEMGQPFLFDLTCDVIGKAEVIETWFSSTKLPEFFNAA